MDALSTKPVARSTLWSIALLLSLAVAPHIVSLNYWVTGFFYSIMAARLFIWPDAHKTAPKFLLVLLTLLSLVIVLKVVGYYEGRQFGVALLIMMLSLKLLELKTRRDLYVTVMLGYFLLITLFLIEKGILLTSYALLLSIGFTAILYSANQVSDQFKPVTALKYSAWITVSALPVMVLLFVFFPRLDGPLWHINFGITENLSGMSDKISMGSISGLSQSEAVAFRVEFAKGEIPLAKDRYWRGVVLWYTNGKTWERGRLADNHSLSVTPQQDPLHYTVTMEASGKPWLFPLDRVVEHSSNTHLNADYELSVTDPIKRRFTYNASATVNYSITQTNPQTLQRALQLPYNVTDRMRQLVNQWKLKYVTDQQVAEAALRHFNQQPFVYTLEPPLVTKNPVDQFMFDSQRGFCEHYATSFATLMRLANIPARVILGYLGGELNPHGGHLVVRQLHAHAWTEIWLKDRGWVRVDPTAAVAPERVERTINPSLSGEGTVLFQVNAPGFIANIWRNTRWMKDNMQLQWHHWVVGYNHARQSGLLDDMGLKSLSQYKRALIGIIGSFVVSGLIFAIYMLRRRKKTGVILTLYNQYKNKLIKAGLNIPVSMGPIDLAKHARTKFPQSSADIQAITQLYSSLRYGDTKSTKVLSHLKKRVHAFKIKK